MVTKIIKMDKKDNKGQVCYDIIFAEVSGQETRAFAFNEALIEGFNVNDCVDIELAEKAGKKGSYLMLQTIAKATEAEFKAVAKPAEVAPAETKPVEKSPAEPSTQSTVTAKPGIGTFPLLRADEIEVRCQQVKENGAVLLLYKNARVDMQRLDEAVGAFNWKKSYQEIKGNMYCTVSIRNPETGEWIDKSDCGTESQTEAEKGEASDAFKRACVCWGSGRELYTAPFIWVKAEDTTIKAMGNKYTCSDGFSVKKIAYNSKGIITALEIVNNKGKTVYTFKA